jgi:hypothetical protein
LKRDKCLQCIECYIQWEYEISMIRFGERAETRTMNKRWRLVVLFAVLGFAIALAEWKYLQYADRHHILIDGMTGILLLCFNPPWLFGLIYIDVKPTESQTITLWHTIILFNSMLYAFIGAILGAIFIRKKN